MYIPKKFIAVVALIGAIAMGWLSHDLTSQLASALSANPRPTEVASLESSEVAPVPGDHLAAASSEPVGPSALQAPPASSPVSPAGGPTNVYLTIVNSPTGTTAPAATVAPMRATVPAPSRAGSGTTTRTPAASRRGTPAQRVGGARTVPPAAAAHSSGTRARAVGGGLILNLTPEMAAAAIGEHIVIAHDGAIVYVGDNGSLTANSGDAVGGGTVALDAQGSSFSSNYDPIVPASKGSGPDTSLTPGRRMPLRQSATGRSINGSGSNTGGSIVGPASLTAGGPAGIPRDASPLVSAFISYTANRTADVAGFEDHSILTRGTGNVVTYDDSNVFISRNGTINANTGDTDSAGLNAIATRRSTVSAGPHCDDGCDDESIIQAQAGVFDEGDVAVDGSGNVVWSPDIVPETESVDVNCDDPAETDDDGCDDSAPEDNGDDDDSVDDESPDGDVSDAAEPAETRVEADSTRPAADNGPEPTGEPAQGALIVGGDGIDDLSERVDGNFNVSSYDDSNVVMGGTGDVNAQIGDSDTGGTVTMDTVDSTVSGGNSR